MKRTCTAWHQETIEERDLTVAYHRLFGPSSALSFARPAPRLDLFHQLGDLGLALLAEFAQSLHNPQPVLNGTILIELLLAFEAKDAKFETDNRLQLRVDIH